MHSLYDALSASLVQVSNVLWQVGCGDGIARPYMARSISVVLVYIREAHPADGWSMGESTNGQHLYKQTHSHGERLEVAAAFVKARKDMLDGVHVVLD